MSEEKVKCQICKKEFKCITGKHIKQHNLTFEEYVEMFPDAPLRSQQSLLRKKQGAKKANESRKGKPRSKETINKIKETKKQNPATAWNKGIPMSAEQKRKLSETRKRKLANGEIIHWNIGNETPEEVKNKISQTLLSQNRTYSEESKQKRVKTINEKIKKGWIHPSYREECIEKRKKTSREKYGVDNFSQQHLPEDVLERLNDEKWLRYQHIDLKKPITEICRELGLHWKNSNKMILNRLKKFEIEQQYHFSSSFPELEIQTLLTENNVSFIANDRTQISPKELDIFIPDLNIAIEYCGLIWHSDAFLDKNYHKIKFDLCAQKNIRLITIFEDEWLHKKEIVKNKILNILGVSKQQKIFARKCVALEITSEEAASFFSTYHIQGHSRSSVYCGLKYDNEIVAVIGYKKRNNPDEYTLNRFATSCTVVGGFSKIERFFETLYKPKLICTFADKRWSVGQLYTNTGYQHVSDLNPDYSYIDTTTNSRIHKFNYRHHNLKNILDNYDENKSELENTRNNKIYRIFNCGLMKFEKTF